MEITIKDDFIKLGQALKLAGVVEDGVQAKYEIQDGNVKVNGEVDQRRGRKVYVGDVITFDGQEIKVIKYLCILNLYNFKILEIIGNFT